MRNIKLDLKSLFKKLSNKQYCIVKFSEDLPSYTAGSDIDIFCYNTANLSEIILNHLHDNIAQKTSIKISAGESQTYIDVMDEDIIHFRFDLYGKLPHYKNILINEAFFSSVIENSQQFVQNDTTFKVPSLIDEIIIRYIEYQEWYAQRADKIKHIEYIQKKIDNAEMDSVQFFDKLHYYTALPMAENNSQTPKGNFIQYLHHQFKNFEIFKLALLHLKQKGLRKTLLKIKNRLMK